MDIMMGMVREDISITYSGSIWSRATNKIADTSTEFVNQNGDIYEQKRRGIFLNLFQHPGFASGYDQNQLIISDVRKKNKHRAVPKLMNIVPK